MKIKKPQIKKRDLIELFVVITLFSVIYFTGSQAEVFGKVQQVVLKTGVMNANSLDEDEYLKATYDFKVRDESGKIIDAETLRGKTIFINIWATWCPPCVAEMPSINELYKDFADNEDIVFLMIAEDKDFEVSKAWIKRKELDLPIVELITPLPDLYETGVVPTTFVISPKEEVVVSKTGMANYDTRRFRKLIRKLDQQKAN